MFMSGKYAQNRAGLLASILSAKTSKLQRFRHGKINHMAHEQHRECYSLPSLNLIKPRFLEIHWWHSMPRDWTGHILKVVAINNPVSEIVNGCVSHTINLSSDTTPPDHTSTVLICSDSLAWLFVQCMFPWLFFSESLLAILPDTPELPAVLLTSFRNKEGACSSSLWGPDNVFACARHLGQVQSNTSILCVRAFHQVQCKGVLKSLCFCPGVVQYHKEALHSFRKIPTMFSAMGDCCQMPESLAGHM